MNPEQLQSLAVLAQAMVPQPVLKWLKGNSRMRSALSVMVLLWVTAATAVQARTASENQALRALCPIGLRANGIWGNERINAAIATL